MAATVQRVTLSMKLEGFSGLKGIDKDFKQFQKTLKLTAPQIDKLVKGITKVHGNTKLSKVAFEGQINALTKLRNNVGIGTVAYQRLSAELDRVRTKMDAVTASAAPQGGMFARLNKQFKKIPVGGRAALGALAGTTTAGLGNTGQLAFAGGAVGGPKGAMIGAAIGATIDSFNFVKSSSEYAASVDRLKIALQGVMKDEKKYNKSLKVIASVSDELNVPIADATKQFTQLSASVLGAGGTVKDAETVFRGVSEAIKATGGDAEDVKSGIRAMSQIFGKGKVSAEELQGQLGERLAGAVTKFAEANGSTLQQLQKDLRDGTVGLDQIMNFAIKLSKDHRNAALEMASSSEEAGQRMTVAFQNLKYELGIMFKEMGGEFQDLITGMLRQLARLLRFINKTNAEVDARIIARKEMRDKFGDKDTANWLENLTFGFVKSKATKDNRAAALEFFNKRFLELLGRTPDDPTGEKSGNFPSLKGGGGDEKQGPLAKFAESAFDVAQQVEETFVKAFKGMEDALVQFVMTGKLNFSDLAKSIIADLTRMLVRAAVTKPLFNFLFPKLANGGVIKGGELVESANGNVFAKNKIVPYANGGIVDKPTLFPMANGMGLMGEAGPEAVMPLKRGRGGRLGVEASGGVGSIVVNVDASGTSVEGDQQQGQELGRLISAAVQSEIIQQQRPGGLLA